MLFIVNSSGVPSVASWMSIGTVSLEQSILPRASTAGTLSQSEAAVPATSGWSGTGGQLAIVAPPSFVGHLAVGDRKRKEGTPVAPAIFLCPLLLVQQGSPSGIGRAPPRALARSGSP